MLTGSDRNTFNRNAVYERLLGYNLFVIDAYGYGKDGTCDKRIQYTGNGGHI